MDNFLKAIRYSCKPHELGFCGPQEVNSKDILKKYLLGKKCSNKLIKKMLDEFIGAVSYYREIARLNNIKDYFDKRVIEAYWLGNGLLDNVKTDDLKNIILTDFVKPDLLTKEKALKIVDKIPSGVVAHHTFHVFFVGSITGRVEITTKLKDVCKVSWGKVVEIFEKDRKIEVETEQLFSKQFKVKIKIDWDKEFLPQLKKDDLVSFHWERVVEKITKKEYNNLIKYTMINYNALKK